MVSRVSAERMRIRKIRINPLATRDLAEKHVLKLVEGFFGHCRGCLRAKPPYKTRFQVVHSAAFSARCKISACKVRHAQKAKFRHSFWV